MKMKDSFKSKSFRIGGYSVFAAVLVIAIIVVVNVLINAVPAKYTQYDTTSNRYYSLSDETKTLLSGLNDDVNIHWIVREGLNNSMLEHLLNSYTSESSHIVIDEIDPDVSPTVVSGYSDSYKDNSLVVEYGDRYRYIDYSEIFVTDMYSYYTTGQATTEFAGESEITSAIDYVLRTELAKMYVLTGHGETELPESYTSAIEKQNVETAPLSIIENGSVPDDCSMLFINYPQSDLSEADKDAILTYLQAGGKLLLVTNPGYGTDDFKNLFAVMEYYGTSPVEGIVLEGDASRTVNGIPYYILPTIASTDLTKSITDHNYLIMLALAQGIQTNEDARDGVKITPLLTTSDEAFAKADLASSAEKEKGDAEGPFDLAVMIEEALENGDSTRLVWFGSPAIDDDSINEAVSGANQDLFLNAVTWMCDPEGSDFSIHTKTIAYERLTVPTNLSGILTALAVAIIPAVFLCIGIVIFVRRRRR